MYLGSVGVKAKVSCLGTSPRNQTDAPMASFAQRSPSATWCAESTTAPVNAPTTIVNKTYILFMAGVSGIMANRQAHLRSGRSVLCQHDCGAAAIEVTRF